MWKFFKKKEESQNKVTYGNIMLHDFIEQVENETIDQSIYDEFIFKIKDKEQTHIAKLLKDINILQTRYNNVMLIVHKLDIERKIKLLNPKIEIPDSDWVWKILMNMIPCRKGEALNIIIVRSNKLLEEKKVKEMELKQLQPVTDGRQRADKNYFNRIIVAVATYHKIQIIRKTQLLCEFVEMLLMMREQQEHLEQELKKQNHGR
jgi:hypothetical protein